MPPFGCLEQHPRRNSVYFCGKFINLKEIGDTYHIDHGYLSRIFNYRRTPSVPMAKRIAAALHMPYDEFINELGLKPREALSRKALPLGHSPE